MPYILQTNQLTKSIGGKNLVTNVSMHVKKGEIYGFLGPNGAGKTTVMKMLTNLWKPTEGSIELFGKKLTPTSYEVLKRMGSIIEFPTFYDHLDGRENLKLHCEYMGYYNPGSIENALEILNLADAGKKPVRSYSLGMKQRLGIARAILSKPELLILDEPTNGLDPNQIVEIRHLIKEIAEERTVILSTHILTEVQATCDYIRMIEQGSMVFSGTVEEFDNYIQPNTLVVSLGAAPLVADIQELPGVVRVEELGGPRFRIQFSDVKEAMNSIVEASYTRDWQLMELQQEKSSLDTIFAELSKK